MHVDRREKIYIIFSIIMLVTFATTLGVSAFVSGFQVPQPVEVVDPRTVATPGVSPFGDPVEERVRELAPNRYEAYILAQTWSFLPREIRVPVGSTVTFYVTSKDVQHGFILEKTNINMMVLPGHVSKLTATFDEPGTYNFVCDEYCGVGHHTMYGQLIVEE
ncbi:MAG: cytochrome C oxidase subunit II [Candidatus Thermofonsia bacterium]|nr:MAG: cytochrome C oxidase subunit II [Candidatus Thermofonsia bacterium]